MVIYYSKALKELFPNVYQILSDNLTRVNVGFMEVNSSNLWIRDFFPVKSRTMGYIKFVYDTKGFDFLEAESDCWNFLNPKESKIILDGGNVEQNESLVLMTDIVYRNNNFTGIMNGLLTQALEKRFDKKLIILPAEPNDDLGHIDGICKFIDEKKVFVNDYSVMKEYKYSMYEEKIHKILISNGLEPVTLPFAYHKCPLLDQEEFYIKYPFADEQNEGTGYYINMLVLPEVVFLPSFGFSPEDAKCLEVVKKYYPQREVIQVDCFDLSQLGGVLHCITYED
jgi:agmatine deiminase